MTVWCVLCDVCEPGGAADLVAVVSVLVFDEVGDSRLLEVAGSGLSERVNLRVGQVRQTLPAGRDPP